jgi:uncharacterized protein
MREAFIFRHFFDGLAFAGAVAEWGLACWLGRFAPPLSFHVAALALLFAVNRAASTRCRQEPASGMFAGRAGAVILGTAFGAIVCASAVFVLATAWLSTWIVGALSAEAGMIGRLAREPVFGNAFRHLATVTVAFTSAAVAYGYARGYRELEVTSLTVPVPGLARTLRLVHVTDLHLGPLADRAVLREAIDRVIGLAPDLVCVTGDIIDSPATDLARWLPELARITAPHGVFTILGNHDARVGTDRVAAAIARWTGWRVLRDEVATIEVNGAPLHLVGLEDRPAIQAAEALPGILARIPADEPAIVLVHRPGVFTAAAEARVPLVLAGHTHGGQIAVPGVPRLNVARLLVTEFDAGTFTRGETMLHVNRGLGTSGQRIRVGAPREISVLTLAPA